MRWENGKRATEIFDHTQNAILTSDLYTAIQQEGVQPLGSKKGGGRPYNFNFKWVVVITVHHLICKCLISFDKISVCSCINIYLRSINVARQSVSKISHVTS